MPPGYGAAGGAPLPPEPPGTPEDRLLRAIEDLDAKVAANGYEKWVPVSLATSGQSQYITTEENPVTMLTVQVFTGSVSIVLSDQTGQAAPSIPYFSFAVVGVPVHIPMGTKKREVTVFATANNTTASVWLHSPSH